jgi:hypothetical protein
VTFGGRVTFAAANAAEAAAERSSFNVPTVFACRQRNEEIIIIKILN